MSLPFLQPYLGLSGGLNTKQSIGNPNNWVYDDFTSYADQTAVDAVYARNTSSIIGSTVDDLINYSVGLDNTPKSLARALSLAASDTSWVLRWRWRITGITYNSTGYQVGVVIGLSDSNQTVNSYTSQDSIGFTAFHENDIKHYKIYGANNDNMINNTYYQFFTERGSIGDDYHMELKRTSATGVSAEIFTGEWVSSLESQTLTISSAIISLDNFVIKDVNNQYGSLAGNQTGTIDDIGFQDGVTVWV